jgi:beta-phosphoglucomutase
MPGARAVVFDFNGTLSDDEPILARVYVEQFAELGKPITEAEYFEQLAGHTDEEMYERWFGRADRALIDDRIDRYNALVADGSTVAEETRAAVLFAASHVPVAIVSAAARREIEPVVRAAGLDAAVTLVVCQDDVARGKPDPECYVTAAQRLGVEPGDLLVFEDTDVGVAAAKAAGTRVIGRTRTLGAARMAGADELVERIDVPLLERLLCS